MAVLVLAVAISTGACSSDGPDAGSGDSATGEGGSQPRVEAPEGSPQVCRDLAAEPRLTDLRSTVREATAAGSRSDDAQDVGPAVEVLRANATSLPSAVRAADALEGWGAAPSDTARLGELAASFTALEKEVQAQCEFPVS